MYKNYTKEAAMSHPAHQRVSQIFLIMRLITFFLIAALMQVSATTLGQKVSLNTKGTSLKAVLKDIRKQCGYNFIVTETGLKQALPVEIKVKDAELKEVLDKIFRDQPLTYSITNKTITINEKQVAPPDIINTVLAPINITGRVVDSVTNTPLGGANVKVLGTKQVVITGSDGSFFLPNVEVPAVLAITFVGYKDKKVQAAKEMGNISMITVISNLKEVGVTVVNTGYQRIRPEQSTGAVSQISTKEYESRVSTNFLDGLVNKLPGLMINNDVQFTSTAPGAGTTTRSLFNIRGISTMSANQNPLIVIDGFPTELTIDMIDPNEIKSVTILKDAAAATVYGVRASNGVIVIERKQAVAGRPRFTFRATAGVTPEENYSRYRWAADQSAVVVNYQKDLSGQSVNSNAWDLLATNTAGSGGVAPRSSVALLLAAQAAHVITPYQAAQSFADLANYNNADDYKRLFSRPAVTETYNFNVSGGNENALYYITANYTGNRLSAINNDNNRLSLSARTTLRFTQRLSMELTTDYQEQHLNSAPVPSIYSFYPYEHLQDVNGNPNFITAQGVTPNYNNVLLGLGLQDNLYYPLTEANEVSDKTRVIGNRITANFVYNMGAGLALTFGGIYEASRSDYTHLASAASYETKRYINDYATPGTGGLITYGVPIGDFLQQQPSNTSSYTARTQLNYNKKIGFHSFNAILGGEVRQLTNSSYLTSQFGYNDQSLLLQPVNYAGLVSGAVSGSLGLGSPLLNNYTGFFNELYTQDRFISGYSNIVYDYKNTYSLSGSIRIDQSNLFGTNPKYKYKPLWSLGAAWNIGKENFMKDVSWINMLKARVAYGFNGNVAKLSLPSVIAQSVANTLTPSSTPALKLLSYANSSLRWEQTATFNAGVDYRIGNKVYGSFDYYTKRSTDLLGNAQIDPTIGVSPSLINQATIKNTGQELSLHADWVTTNKFNWNTGLVLAHNTSKVLDVYRTGDFNPQALNSVGFVKGYPVGALFAYRYAGLDNKGYPLISNDRGKLYNTETSTTADPTSIAIKSDTSGVTRYMGSSIPTINAGLSNRVDIGNFYVYCMINYYGGFKVLVPRPNQSSSRPLPGAGDYWKVPGDENNTDVMALATRTSANALNAYNYADKYVVNGDYLTLGDVTLSYSLDDFRFIKKAGFSHFEIKCQASNVYTLGLNKYNYSAATGSYQKPYVTPTYTVGIFTNF